MSLMPVPPEVRRQLGERGICPSQEGQETTRAQRYDQTYLWARVVSNSLRFSASDSCGSWGYTPSSSSSTRFRKRVLTEL